MKITLEIPDETVCVHFTLGLQNASDWGMASFQMENPKDGGYVRLEMPGEMSKESEP